MTYEESPSRTIKPVHDGDLPPLPTKHTTTTIEQTLDEVRMGLNRVKLNWGKEKPLIDTLDAVITALKMVQLEFKAHERRFAALENDFGEHLLEHEKKEGPA